MKFNFTLFIILILHSFCSWSAATLNPDGICPDSLSGQYGSTTEYLVTLENACAGQEVLWSVDGADPVPGNSTYTASFSASGTYTISATFTDPDCSATTTLFTEVVFELVDCNFEISVLPNGECNSYNFEVLIESANFPVQWDFGDETNATGPVVDHQYTSPGSYTITTYLDPVCSASVNTFTLEVTECAATCDANFSVLYGENGEATFVNSSMSSTSDGLQYEWSFGEGSSSLEESPTFQFIENGIYVVCLYQDIIQDNNTICFSASCQEIEITNYYGEIDCPDSIYVTQTEICDVWTFEFGSFAEGEEVIWHFDNNPSETGTHFIEHSFVGNGAHQVCALYTSNTCPDGAEMCTTIDQLCNNSDCTLEVITTNIDCESLSLEVQNAPANTEIHWNVDGNPFNTGSTNTFSLTPGVHTICAWYENENCPFGVEWCETLTIEECPPNCPTEINVVYSENCAQVEFEVGSFEDGQSVDWSFGDEYQVTSGHFISHVYTQNGTYEVCAIYTGPHCPNGATVCDSIEINCPQTECFITVTALTEECDHLVLNAAVEPMNNLSDSGENVTWWINDEIVGQGPLVNIPVSEGIVTICATYNNLQCTSALEECHTYTIAPCPACTNVEFVMISDVQSGGPFIVDWSISNLTENVEFDQGNIFFTEIEDIFHTSYCLDQGCFRIHLESPDSFDPTAVELQANGGWEIIESTPLPDNNGYDVVISLNGGCAIDPCQIQITPTFLGGTSFEFFASGTPEIYPMTWDFGDGTVMEATWVVSHEFEPGTYIVCGSVNDENCGVVMDCFEINVLDPLSLCPLNVSLVEQTCTSLTASATTNEGNSEIHWTVDGEEYNVGSVTTFELTNGLHEICAWYHSAICDTIIQNCEMIEFGCTCTEVDLSLSSQIPDGGPEIVYWGLYDLNDILITNGVFGFSNEVTDALANLCIEDGCYYIQLESSTPLNNPANFTQGLLVNGQVTDISLLPEAGGNILNLYFGINSACEPVNSCSASFFADYTSQSGFVDFLNNSNYIGNAEWLWTFGNGQQSTQEFTSLNYPENGIYEVCLTVSTGDCESSYCQNILIQGATSCQTNSLLFNISADYTNNQEVDFIDFSLQLDGEPIQEWSMVTNIGFSSGLEFCLPDNCYTLEISTQSPLLANSITTTILDGNVNIGTLSYLNNSLADTLQLGLNVDCVDNVIELVQNEFLIYPNPANEQVRLQMTNNQPIQILEIYDGTGRLVLSRSPKTYGVNLNLETLPSGLYTIRISDLLHTSTQKLEILR
jgi:PKD repeat protein